MKVEIPDDKVDEIISRLGLWVERLRHQLKVIPNEPSLQEPVERVDQHTGEKSYKPASHSAMESAKSDLEMVDVLLNAIYAQKIISENEELLKNANQEAS